jgi:hypothetical protein
MVAGDSLPDLRTWRDSLAQEKGCVHIKMADEGMLGSDRAKESDRPYRMTISGVQMVSLGSENWRRRKDGEATGVLGTEWCAVQDGMGD